MALLSAADLAERVEQVVLPALRAGLVVIADRYRWTPMARAEARGVDGRWLDDLFAFVPPPDAVLFLEVDAQTSLIRRDLDPDPYEAGLDLGLSADLRESYRLFQERLAACFDRYATETPFIRIDATGTTDDVGPAVIRAAGAVLAARSKPIGAVPTPRPARPLDDTSSTCRTSTSPARPSSPRPSTSWSTPPGRSSRTS
jgi:dTMP kinase